MLSTLPRTIFDAVGGDSWDFEALRTALQGNLGSCNRHTVIKAIQPLVSGLSISALPVQPSSIVPPIHVPVLAMISGHSKSSDLLRQFVNNNRGTRQSLGHMQDLCPIGPCLIQLSLMLQWTSQPLQSTLHLWPKKWQSLSRLSTSSEPPTSSSILPTSLIRQSGPASSAQATQPRGQQAGLEGQEPH